MTYDKSSLPSIICLDDEEEILTVLSRVLERHFNVLAFTDSEEALKRLTQEPTIALLLADLHMPKLNGIEVLKKTKVISPTTVRVILSGQIDLQDMMTAINQAEIDRFILKPWDNEYLKIQMLEALQIHSLLSEKKQLQHLAITDVVTGLRNHRFFQEVLNSEVERSQRHNRKLSLIMTDIDHFKKFNDSFGHPEGDRALALVGQILQQEVRTVDTVARYGGEEFAIVLPETDLAQTKEVCERLRQAIESADTLGPDKRLTISLGAAEYRIDEPTQSLIDRADQALYKSKNSGRNRSTFSE